MTAEARVGEDAETNLFSAAPSALGYLAQVEYALLLTLQRLDTHFDFDLSIETLDDIVFHQSASSAPPELFQSKHRVDRTASMSDHSTDVWKTLHNWAIESPEGASLTFITNATAPPGSASARLRAGSDRDVDGALSALETIARTSESKEHQRYYETFFSMGPDGRRALLDQITVLDAVPAVDDLERELSLAVRKSVVPAHREVLVERLRGWWLAKVYDHLSRVASGSRDRISGLEVENQLLAIAQTLRDDDLPIDFYDMPLPPAAEVADDERVFVDQLRLIALSNQRIRQCIYDHNRAFAQRSRWEREKLLHVGELKDFEDRLRDEWRRFCLPDSDEDDLSEHQIETQARDRFIRLDQSQLPRIRKHVDAGYVANGSMHILADRLEIGWHPAWLERIRRLLPELSADAGSVA